MGNKRWYGDEAPGSKRHRWALVYWAMEIKAPRRARS